MVADTALRTVSLVDGGRATMFNHDELADLLDMALAPTSTPSGVQRLLYAQDLTQMAAAAPSVMVITVGCEHGAAFLRDGRRSWLTKDDHGPTYTGPELLYDPVMSSTYPADAVLPLGRLRRIASAYLQSGRRPASFSWQPASKPLPW